MGFNEVALLSTPSQVTLYCPRALKPALMASSPDPASKVTASPVWPPVSVADMSRSPPSASPAVCAETFVVPTGIGAVTVCRVVKPSMVRPGVPWASVLLIVIRVLVIRPKLAPETVCAGCWTK